MALDSQAEILHPGKTMWFIRNRDDSFLYRRAPKKPAELKSLPLRGRDLSSSQSIFMFDNYLFVLLVLLGLFLRH